MALMLSLAAAAALTSVQLPPTSAVIDRDRDGLDDRFEQRLIERFQPRFHVSSSDCAGRPSSFAPDVAEPTPVAQDGTIYARVFPAERPGQPGAWIEVQYFHLWAHDCGWNSHPLDVEHVSALVGAASGGAPAQAWTARHWYAAAHQATICNASHGARAEALDAVDRGANVWIAKGKHASYLHRGRCRWGCGTDRCPDTVAIQPAALVNIGERDAPLNGAHWIASAAWPLAAQMRSDFTPAVVARIERAEHIVAVHDVGKMLKAFLMGTGTGARWLLQSQKEVRGGIGATFRAMGRAVVVTGRTIIGR